VSVEVLTSAQTAELQFRASATTGPVTLEIAGTNGVEVMSFGSNTPVADILTAVNSVADSLGVRAEYINSANPNSGLTFTSSGYGVRNFVSVEAKSGTFATVDESGNQRTRDVGQDVVATVNGALAVGDGRNVKLNTATLDVELTLAEDFGVGSTSFAITDGGALFQLGPQVTTNQQVNVAIQSVAASNLGDDEVGFLSDIQTGGPAALRTDAARASQIIEKAIRQVSLVRGRLGAFEKNTLQTNMNSLQIALENVTASESTIRDADFAEETARLTRAQILTQAGTSVLATANATPQNVLSLLQ
jgi:flagellin